MITVSLTPFDLRKAAALVFTLLCLSSVSCFAGESLFVGVPSTPYDKQMTRIQPILFTKAAQNEELSMGVVNQWIQDLRAIPYGFSPQWKTPSEVMHSPAADCKGKAVALYQKMRSNGAQNLRLVIGRKSWNSAKTHAWVEWNTPNGSFVLDPTINWAATKSERVSRYSYVPLYAYAGGKKYRAASSSSLVAMR